MSCALSSHLLEKSGNSCSLGPLGDAHLFRRDPPAWVGELWSYKCLLFSKGEAQCEEPHLVAFGGMFNYTEPFRKRRTERPAVRWLAADGFVIPRKLLISNHFEKR
jgi:hypothetical protein